MSEPDRRSKTDKVIVDNAQGTAERLLLGTNPYGSMLRIFGVVLAFILIAGTVFYVVGQ
ncbi:hypothetical protein DevBK_00985 [Devosia sp. BK]|uniref:hypothetical protein n=1 Tax=Devosia sp. BK TaxID=2871706 RepID=UPI00293B8513|nr:hypothetical protein [Devosia sp. BK]MDV3249895.1 hypothetical protein [Devosia sp. BK]